MSLTADVDVPEAASPGEMVVMSKPGCMTVGVGRDDDDPSAAEEAICSCSCCCRFWLELFVATTVGGGGGGGDLTKICFTFEFDLFTFRILPSFRNYKCLKIFISQD